MSRSINPIGWLKTLYANSANVRRLALKAAVFTIRLLIWALWKVVVGILTFYALFGATILLVVTLFDVTTNPVSNMRSPSKQTAREQVGEKVREIRQSFKSLWDRS